MTVLGRFDDGCGPARVAVVLPPRESFSADGAGAISLVVRHLAAADRACRTVVVGRAPAAAFAGIAFRATPKTLLPLAGYAGAVARVLRRLGPVLVEVHNRPLVALRVAQLGVPVVLFLHNDPLSMRGCRTPAERARLHDRLAGVVCVSGWVRDRLGLPDARVLANCIDLSALPEGPERREKLILFAGRVVADKGADAFVAACARALPALPGWSAEMIGADRFGAKSPETPFLRRLRPLAAQAGVRLVGWQPHRAVLEAMARAAIVVVPSRWPEPFGLTALEAMASGAALVYAPRGGLPEVVGEAGEPIDPDDPAGMADTLVSLARDPARRASLGRAGGQRAQEFDVGPTVARLDALRHEILAAWPRPPADPI